MIAFGHDGTGPGDFDRAGGLGHRCGGRIYVADSCNHRIQVFSPEGKFLRSYGKAGTGPGELSYPYDIAWISAGQAICLRVWQQPHPGFRCERAIGGNHRQAPAARRANSATRGASRLDSKGNLYVADSQNHRVQKFIEANSRPA